jgi:hypothetical protein
MSTYIDSQNNAFGNCALQFEIHFLILTLFYQNDPRGEIKMW